LQLANASQKVVTICLTGKVETILPAYKAAFLNAADLALKNNSNTGSFLLKFYFFDNKPLAALRVYHEMLDDNCSAIIGYEYLSDLLLVSKEQKDTNIPIFTSYASSLNADQLPKNIFIFMPSYDYQAEKMVNFLEKKYGHLGNVLVLTEVDTTALAKYKEAYQYILGDKKIRFDTFDFLANDQSFDEKLKLFLRDKHYDYVFVLGAAVGSTKVIDIMNDHKTVFIGTEYFGSSTNQSVFSRLKDKNVTAYIIRNIDLIKKTKALSDFSENYVMHYKMSPNPLAVYTYDAMNILIRAFDEFKSVSTNDILKLDYIGISKAYLKNGSFHRSSEYIILLLEKNGFTYVESL